MNSKIIFLGTIAVLLVFFAGCSVAQRQVIQGKTTPEGNLIFYEWTAGRNKRYAALKDSYGMMIFYDAFSKKPVTRFELYIHKNRSIIRTTNLAVFKGELCRIHAGERLHYYNTCAGGTHHGLDPGVLEEIRTYCSDKGIVFQEGDDELFVICTCL